MEIRRPRTAGQPHTTYPQGPSDPGGAIGPFTPPPQILAEVEAKSVPSTDLGFLINPPNLTRFSDLPTAQLHIPAGKLQATTDHIVNGNENTYLANKMKSRKLEKCHTFSFFRQNVTRYRATKG